MMRLASIVFALLAVGLLGYAGYRYFSDEPEPPPGQALVVHEPARDVGAHPCDAAVPVRFRITNRSSQPVRVLGLVPG